jgi:hypothetical protein
VYAVITRRTIKVNTNSTEAFAPRTSNTEKLTVSGPFGSVEESGKACLAALATHTCLEAQIWSAAQIADKLSKTYNLTHGLESALREAQRLVEVC